MKISLTQEPSLMSSKNARRRLEALWRQRWLQLMAIPGAIWMFIFCFIPIYGISIAFLHYNITKPMSAAPFAGFVHFIEFFSDDNFHIVMRNTLCISLLKLAIGFPLPIVFALLLNEIRNQRFKRPVQTISYLPHFLSWAVLGAMMMNWLSKEGLVNGIAMALRLQKEPVYYLAEPNYFWGIAVASEVWKELGWNAIIYLAAISGVDQDLYESAVIDGAGRFRKMWNITLPSINGTIMLLLVLNIAYMMGSNFDQILILTNQLNLEYSNTIDLYVYRMGIQTGRFSYATAVGVFRSVVSLLLLLIANTSAKWLSGKSLF
jgi:putative aldouronate transport system permease protein